MEVQRQNLMSSFHNKKKSKKTQQKIIRPSTRASRSDNNKKMSSSLNVSSTVYVSAAEASVELLEEQTGEESVVDISQIQDTSTGGNSSRDVSSRRLKKKAESMRDIRSTTDDDTKEDPPRNSSQKKRRSSHSGKAKRGQEEMPPAILPFGLPIASNSGHSTSLTSSRETTVRSNNRSQQSLFSNDGSRRKLPDDVQANAMIQTMAAAGTKAKRTTSETKIKKKKIKKEMATLTAEVDKLEAEVNDMMDNLSSSSTRKLQKKKSQRRRSSPNVEKPTMPANDSKLLFCKRASDHGPPQSQRLGRASPSDGPGASHPASPREKRKKRRSSSSTQRAPIPPGDDIDMEPVRREIHGVARVAPLPVAVHQSSHTSKRRRSSRKSKAQIVPSVESSGARGASFSTAVVAAAVADATAHGRAFDHQDVTDRHAFDELSHDPISSKHFQSMRQSFKAKSSPPSSPTRGTPPQTDGNSSKSLSPLVRNSKHPVTPARPQSSLQDSQRGSWRDRRPFGCNNRSSVDSSTSGVPSETASDAVKNVLEISETTTHEMKFKVALLASVFDDVHQDTNVEDSSAILEGPQRTHRGSTGIATGDAAIVPTKHHRSSKKHSKQSAAQTPRDVDEGMPKSNAATKLTTSFKAMDMEKGLGFPEEDTEATMVSRRLSFKQPHLNAAVKLFKVKEEGDKWRNLWKIIALIVFIAGIVAAIAGGIAAARKPRGSDIDLGGPTAAPTSFQHDVLPEYTQLAFEYPTSPQARAYYWLEHGVERSSLSVATALQRFVLATLFYATAGDQWRKSEDWMAYTQFECQWHRHEFNSICDVAQRYHTLSLPDNSLQGTLPEELELLSALSIVQLQNNQLIGTLPTRIWSSWEHLVFMNVYNNSLSGTLPTDIGFLADAAHLHTLSLRSNIFSGAIPSEIGLLSLKYLSLSGNMLSNTLPTELGLLSNARDLYLYSNSFTGIIPTSLGLLSKLTRLELHGNDMAGSVPTEVCDLISAGSLITLTVDCTQIQCTCGCDCTAELDIRTSITIFESDRGDQ